MYAQIGLSNAVTSTFDYTGIYTQNYASFQLTSLHRVALCSLDTGSVVKKRKVHTYLTRGAASSYVLIQRDQKSFKCLTKYTLKYVRNFIIYRIYKNYSK
jgi:hypothetical protein